VKLDTGHNLELARTHDDRGRCPVCKTLGAEIGIIGILVTGHDLVHPLPQQRQAGVPNPAALSGIAEMLS
jgi:hypothetical protein